MSWQEHIMAAHLAVTDAVRHGSAMKSDRYFVWQEDGAKDFSGGSFQDMTRVARLNENMWTELFLDNGDNLANEIDGLIARMQAYSTAIKARDADTLRELLKEGREKCIAIDEIKDFD